MVDTLSDYKWSSHKGYIFGKSEWQWLYKTFILSMLSPNKQEQKEQYKAFIRLEVSNELESFYSKKNQPSILGEEKFLNWVKETFFRKKIRSGNPGIKTIGTGN